MLFFAKAKITAKIEFTYTQILFDYSQDFWQWVILVLEVQLLT